MIGKVFIGIYLSELMMVEDQHKTFSEEHPGVSNRILEKVGLDGSKPL